MKPEEVLKITKNSIETIYKIREDKQRKYIQGIVNKKNSGFFHKLFKLKDTTYEEIVKYLDIHYEDPYNDDILYGYWCCKEAYSKAYKIASDLFVAASKVDQDMYISVEDYSIIITDELKWGK